VIVGWICFSPPPSVAAVDFESHDCCITCVDVHVAARAACGLKTSIRELIGGVFPFDNFLGGWASIDPDLGVAERIRYPLADEVCEISRLATRRRVLTAPIAGFIGAAVPIADGELSDRAFEFERRVEASAGT